MILKNCILYLSALPFVKTRKEKTRVTKVRAFVRTTLAYSFKFLDDESQ